MSDIVIVDVWAEWCAPCKRFGPIFEKASIQHPDVDFVKINADENHEFLQLHRIQSIPMILGFRYGLLVYSHAGILSESEFESVISDIRE